MCITGSYRIGIVLTIPHYLWKQGSLRLSWQYPALTSLFEEAVEASNTASIPDAVKMLKLRGTDGVIKTIIVMILYIKNMGKCKNKNVQKYLLFLIVCYLETSKLETSISGLVLKRGVQLMWNHACNFRPQECIGRVTVENVRKD